MTVIRVARQRLHMGDELAAAGRRQGGGDRDLDPELVRPVCLALADAFHLRRVQRIDLWSALALRLLAHLSGQRQNASEHHLLEPAIPLDLAADVADDAAEIGSK